MTTIILTSTIHVKDYIDCVYQKDAYERLQTYLRSILQWLRKTNFNIVVVENSGYNFCELNDEKEIYKDRFEVITFDYKNIEELKNLEYVFSKGVNEIFAIDYAIKNSSIIKKSNFIIKVTGRFFIEELENYLSQFDLNEFDCLTQSNNFRSEMVGSHVKNLNHIFNTNVYDDNINFKEVVEAVYQYRTLKYKKVLLCKTFKINKTQRGGLPEYYEDI